MYETVLYHADVSQASDFSDVSLANTNALPADKIAVQKTLWLDILAELRNKVSIGTCSSYDM
jgi:hypothetical protein